jgi:ubiquinone/menaquinone biosynthesis C-methylase UbiE
MKNQTNIKVYEGDYYKKNYENFLKGFIRRMIYRNEWFLIQPSYLVLDIACGFGSFLKAAPKQFNTKEMYIGVDISITALKHLKEYCIIRADITKLPMRENLFYTTICNNIIEHLNMKELSLLLKESIFVMRPQGNILIRTPDIDKVKENFYKDPTHKIPYNLNKIKHTLQKNNFIVDMATIDIFSLYNYNKKINPIFNFLLSLIKEGNILIIARAKKFVPFLENAIGVD